MSNLCVVCGATDCAHLVRILADLEVDMPNEPGSERLGGDLWDDVERFAEEEGTTTSVIVREAVRQYANARNRATTR